MIVSETPIRVSSRRFQVCALLCAMVVLPLGVVHAQDYEAVGKRLAAAVEAGELSGEQARGMMGALKKAGDTGKAQDAERVKAHLTELKKKLGAAVENGRISEEEAAKKYAATEKMIREKMAGSRGPTRDKENAKLAGAREHLMKLRKELGAAVEAGKISEEEAAKRVEAVEKAIREKMAGRNQGDAKKAADSIEGWIESVGEQLKGAVEAGKLSEEEAWAKWHAIKEKEIAPKLKATVKAGKMTEKEAWDLWQGIEKAEVGERLKAAVEKGEISEKEARAKWAEIEKDGKK